MLPPLSSITDNGEFCGTIYVVQKGKVVQTKRLQQRVTYTVQQQLQRV